MGKNILQDFHINLICFPTDCLIRVKLPFGNLLRFHVKVASHFHYALLICMKDAV